MVHTQALKGPRDTEFSITHFSTMGSDSSKPTKAQQPLKDTDPVGTHTFTASFPAPCDYAAFAVRFCFSFVSTFGIPCLSALLTSLVLRII